MLTTVVNFYRTKAWDVYIGRAGHGQDGYYGNPCEVGPGGCSVCGGVHLDRDDAVECFRTEYFERRLAVDPKFRRCVANLYGYRLACFCAPKRCHGDVIAAFCDALGARKGFVRSDDAALALVRASRALSASRRTPHGSLYVVGDERFVVHRVTPSGVVLRNLRHGGGYVLSECTGPIDPARWT